ncbi:MAG TPA: CPBP family intramembrane glutamic endopeptidase, partial [Thermoanaerobaculia bacterium]|nr:CPBP family intramembrane glutamic endopeptidase [Thermoanaerobaculia bacterium]
MSEPAAGPPRPPRFFPIAASFYLALAVTGVVGLGLAHGRLGPDLLADPGGWWVDLGLGVGAGLALLALWELMRRLAAGARRVEVELAALIGELSPGEAAAIALVSAISEEIAFRGAFQEWIGWVPSALLFGLLHLGPGKHYRWWTLWSLAGGLGLGLMVDQRGSLGAAILAHLIVNGVQLQRLRGHGARSAPGEPPPGPEGAPAPGEPEPSGEA